jgi:hypothetical protein
MGRRSPSVMQAPELLSIHEIAILAAVQRGAVRPGAIARRVPALEPAAEVLLHDALRCWSITGSSAADARRAGAAIR